MDDFGYESLFLLESEENRERVSHAHTNNCWKQNKVIKIKDVLCFSIVTIGDCPKYLQKQNLPNKIKDNSIRETNNNQWQQQHNLHKQQQ